MISIQLLRIEPETQPYEALHSTVAPPPHDSVSVVYIADPHLLDVGTTRARAMRAVFDRLVIVVHTRNRSPGWREARDNVRRWKRYINCEIVTPRDHSELNDWQVLGEVAKGSADAETQQLVEGFLRSEKTKLSVQAGYLTTLVENMREPRRARALSHLTYYKPLDICSRTNREVQHVHFFDFVEQHCGLQFDFASRSFLEIGPAAGYAYQYARSRGATSIYVIEKNAGFCGVATLDAVDGLIEHDLTEPGFLDAIQEALPRTIDYVFAKGVLNVYAFDDLSIYRRIVDTLTSRARFGGLWVTYNIDRERGHDPEKRAFSARAFEENGWQRFDVSPDIAHLTGLNFQPEVDTALWVLSR